MMWSCIFLLFIPLYHVYCDVYGHTPRFSNNRLDGDRRERNTNNRIFDSQNNARAGYNVGGANDRYLTLSDIYKKAKEMNGTGIRAKMEEEQGPPGKMKYHEGSILDVTWTNQHECGGTNSNCEIIFQYMCSDNLRDGIKDARIPENVNDCDIGEDKTNKNCEEDRRYGMHETLRYYTLCKNTKRNTRLFGADQELSNRFTSKYTRQNRNGNRNGYECPEERDYYPYWRPTPWIDIAIMTNDMARCEEYKNQSENVKPRYYCKVPEALVKKLIAEKREDQRIPITEQECAKFKYEEEGGQWVKDDRPTYSAPECIPSPKNRDNHHGNKPDGFFNSYKWTIPNTPHKHCALRIRYNISTPETPWSNAHEIAETPQLKAANEANYRCTGKVDNGCCTPETPCALGEGDCDRDDHCGAGLLCGTDNSPWDTSTDVCITDEAQVKAPAAKLISATASSVHNNDNERYGPQLAFSGRSNHGSGYFHSKTEDNPWVSMHIEPTELSSITIINRKNCCGERLKNVEIRAGTSSVWSDNAVVGTFDGPGVSRGEYVIPFKQPVLVKYISIQIKGLRQILQINGIKVNEVNAKFQELGCFKDERKRAISGGFVRMEPVNAIQLCANKAEKAGHEIFAVQNNNECFTDAISSVTNAEQTYARYNTTTGCRNGRGGSLRQNVYKIVRTAAQATAAAAAASTASANKPPRCRGEDNGCCTEDLPCEYGEGDCDTDVQCKGTLICGFNNCFSRFGRSDDCCTDNSIPSLIGADASEAKERGFVFKQNPVVKPLQLLDGQEDIGKLLDLNLAINTAQYGRTFQDRTHDFSIIKRPTNLENKKIYNMEVRGKRGNIVQVYPATEYDYSPNRLEAQKDDYLHLQWTGSERNPLNNAGNGRNGYDRNNMILMAEQTFPEGTPGKPLALDLKNGDWGKNYVADLTNDDGKTLFGWSLDDRRQLAFSGDIEYQATPEAIKVVSSPLTTALEFTCNMSQEIRVISAQYGGICDQFVNECSKCTGLNSLERLKDACDGERECAVPRTTIFALLDSCDRIEGSMQVTYRCLDAPARDYTCQFRRGGGNGAQVRLSRQRGTSCAEACWKLGFVDRSVNGVTVSNELNNDCLCERGMTSRKPQDSRLKSCFFDKLETRPTLGNCAEEKGVCVKQDGVAQSEGKTTISASNKYDCLYKCRVSSDATGCEWTSSSKVCTKHTRNVTRGNGGGDSACWVFSNCKDCWTHTSPGCIQRSNLKTFAQLSVEECKAKCSQHPHCYAIEYGVAHGGEETEHAPGSCILQTTRRLNTCDGKKLNLDLYVTKTCPPAYECQEGTFPLIRSTKDSYWCSDTNDGGYASEQLTMNACDNDPTCTGYDYSDHYTWGRTCKQTDYPGTSSKGQSHGYKLCKKLATSSTTTPTDTATSAVANRYDVSLYRCNGQDNGCCTSSTPCELLEGDCDRDDECKGQLICGVDNCPWGDRDDCCIKPSYLQLDAALHYFNLEPKQLSKTGEFKYMCTRNNDFSNRSQKGKVKVSEIENVGTKRSLEKSEKEKSDPAAVKGTTDNTDEFLEDLDDLEKMLF